MAKMKLHIVEKFYYEVEVDDVEGFDDAKEKFYKKCIFITGRAHPGEP